MARSKLDGAADTVKDQLRETFERIARLHRKRARDRARKMGDDAEAIRERDRFDHLPDSLRDVHAMDQYTRPPTSTYFSEDDLADHASRFDGGGTRFVRADDWRRFGLTRDDGTTFVMSTAEVEDLMDRTGGDPDLMAQELGLADGFFDGDILRIDIPDARGANARMPSGNEDGANEWWLPGGTLPGGISEATIDGGSLVEDVDFTVKPFRLGG
ncbi:hypothetical protein [Agrococcus jejuensis]|uniref:hypothetical protein n=1 Tax=Agrococcus jejuensis TaxID=399736 RepID=UPI0011A231E4|nr:hypothetical protein [Agrococcus jejuensis]